MRYSLLSALILAPVFAHAQTAVPAKTSADLTLQAKVNAPKHLGSGQKNPIMLKVISPSLHLREDIKVVDKENPDLREGGTFGFTVFNDKEPDFTAPKLVHVVGRDLAPDLMLTSIDSDVAVRVTVDVEGNPERLKIAHSAGAALDEKTLEAVRQYHFAPAMENSRPVISDLTVEVKLQKQ